MKRRHDCPGCGGQRFAGELRLRRQPVVLNYRFRSPVEASRVARRDLQLIQCQSCGLVFNAVFDPAVIPYDQNYENRQCFSPAFRRHLERLAASLIEESSLKGGRVLEVGCGKGDFLRLICRQAKAQGVGFDTSFEPPAGPEEAGLVFHRRYLSAAEVPGKFDAVICRHVIEHVPEIGGFLRELRDIAAAAGDPVVLLETPRFEWIVEHRCLWDIFYEHCNYFPTRTLAYLCRRAGFRVRRHRSVFGGQYQVLALAVERPEVALPRPPGILPGTDLVRFSRRATHELETLSARLLRTSGGRGWAIWGAGAKGVALASQLPGPRPACAVDANPAKQGGVLPGTRIPIVSPEDSRLLRLGLILIANPNYAAEIRASLRRIGFGGAVQTL